MKKIVIFIFLLLLFQVKIFCQAQWDGDNASGNFSYDNNWYENSSPGSGNNVDLQFRLINNASQTSIYYDWGWADFREIIFYSTLNGKALQFNGSGSGINFYGKIENLDTSKRYINIPLSGKNSTNLEIDPTNGDFELTSAFYNDNNKPIYIYGDNGKMLTLSGSCNIPGTGSKFIIKQNSKVKICCNQSWSGNTEIDDGEFWVDSGTLATSHIYVGNSDLMSKITKLWLSDNDGGLTLDDNITVKNGDANTRYIGGLNSSGTNTYSGTVTLNGPVCLEANQSGGKVEFAGVISGTKDVNITGAGTVLFSSTNTYTGSTTITSGTLQFSANNSISNLTLGNGATLTIDNDKTLTITGNFTNNGGTISSSGTIKFAGSSAQTISGSTTFENFTLDNSNGLTLNVGVNVNGTLTITTGKITLGSNDLTIASGGTISGVSSSNYIVTNSTGSLIRTVGTSTVDFLVGSSSYYFPVSITGNASVISGTIKVRSDGVNPTSGRIGISNNPVVNTYYIEKGTFDFNGVSANVEFYWMASEEGTTFDRTKSFPARWNGSSWISHRTGTLTRDNSSEPYSVRVDNISGFSPWGIFSGDNDDPTLPVGLSTFTAQYLNSTPTLYWETQSETDNMGWFVYRNQVEDFTSATKVSGMIEGHGTTTQMQSYIYEDVIANPQVGEVYYYWLESVDYSGTIHHFNKVAMITIPETNDPNQNITPPKVYDLLASPNPFNETTNIEFMLTQTAMVDVAIYDVKGALVKSFSSLHVTADDLVSLQWNGKDEHSKTLSNGIYLYSVQVNGQEYATKQLILMR